MLNQSKKIFMLTILLLCSCEDDFININNITNTIEDYTYIEETENESPAYFHSQDLETLTYFINLLNPNLDPTDLYESDKLQWNWVINNIEDSMYSGYSLESLIFNNSGVTDNQLIYIVNLSRLKSLTILNEDDITELPFTLSESLPLLETFIVDNLKDLKLIPDLPTNALKKLIISDCEELENISPNPFAISSIEFLNLNGINANYILNNIEFDLPNVQELILQGENFSGQLTEDFYNLTTLNYLDISYTLIDGSILENISQLEDLETLRLAHNSFSGDIPFENETGNAIGILSLALDDLSSLDLSDNQLTGQIPSNLFSNYNLYSIDLGSNNLSGDIPDTICSFLEQDLYNDYIFVDISDNNFCENIPACTEDSDNNIDTTPQNCDE